VRATTAFNKMLAIPGADVAGVQFSPAGIVVGLRRRARRLRCPCGWSTRAVYDRSTRRWRHLDLGAARLYLEAEIRRLACPACGRVRTETVPWARPGARFTRDFEDVVVYLAQRTDKTTITRLLRCSWEAVAAIVTRVVAEHLDDTRLEGLDRIGIDEVSYRKGHRYLTVVADHDRAGAVVWAGEGMSSATLERFFDALGAERTARLQAASMDLHGAYAKVTRARAPHARVCADPFHIIQLANAATDEVRRAAWNTTRRAAGVARPGPLARVRQDPAAQLVKNTRWALLKDPASWTDRQRQTITRLRRARHVLFRAWVLKEELRDLYRLPLGGRPDAHLDAWLARASRCRIPAMLDLSRTIRRHRDQILAAVDLGLSNSKLEGLNSKIRLINHRGYGHHSAAAVIAMIYLCCSGLTVTLPTER
jgi:transposase